MHARRRRVHDSAAVGALPKSQGTSQRLELNNWMLWMILWLQGLPEGQAPEGFGPKEAAPVIKDFAARWTSALEALHRCCVAGSSCITSCHSYSGCYLQTSGRWHIKADMAARVHGCREVLKDFNKSPCGKEVANAAMSQLMG